MADATERAAAFLAHFIDTTPPEKRDWTPSVEGATDLRCMLDMVDECIVANGIFTGIFRGEPLPEGNPFGGPRRFATWDEGKEKLLASARELAGVIRALTDDDLEKEFVSRRGSMAGKLLIEFALRNMHYHTGQVNLFQLLYGDATFHFPQPKS